MAEADTIDGHERLVAALARAQAPARRIRTHISDLVLAGDRAWKLRRPVRLPFLDFSTADRRRADCEAELRLNRRTAPELYLGVHPVGGTVDAPTIGGDAAGAIDWLLEMRRFDDGATLDALARRGALDAALVDALAARIAAFHEALPPAPEGFGRADALRRLALDNLDALAATVAGGRLAALRDWTEASHARLAPLIEQRRAQGRVREGHGDLHLGNIVLWRGEPLPFDALEFDAALRHGDVIADLAFTFMDLLRHGLPGLAWRFASGWAEHTGDHDGLALLHALAAYRALVRAKVAALRLGADDAAPAALERDLALAEALAFGRFAPSREPRLVLTGGFSGAGKSRLALRLVERLGAARLRSDVERKRLFGFGADARVPEAEAPRVYGVEAGAQTFARLADKAAALLAAGLHVVVDAAFLRRAERDRFRAVAARGGARFTLVECRADETVMRARIRSRAAEGHDASDATEAVLDAQLRFAEPFAPEEGALVVPTDRGDDATDAALAALEAGAFA